MEYQLFANEVDDLVAFLTMSEWPFHRNTIVHEKDVRKAIADGYYEDDRETYWIIDGGVKIGLLIINDIGDSIPIIDIRISSGARGKGRGVAALCWLQDYLFLQKNKIRIEGYTRDDNIAMRKCFVKARFVKEGYLRNSWENADGTISDTIIYGAIKSDWIQKKITPITFDDLPY